MKGKYHDPVEDPEGKDLVPSWRDSLLLFQDALLLHPPPPWIEKTYLTADTNGNTNGIQRGKVKYKGNAKRDTKEIK